MGGAREVAHGVVDFPHLNVGLLEQALIECAVVAGDLFGFGEGLSVLVGGLFGESEVFVDVADVFEGFAGFEGGFEFEFFVADFGVCDGEGVEAAFDDFCGGDALAWFVVEADFVEVLDFEQVADLGCEEVGAGAFSFLNDEDASGEMGGMDGVVCGGVVDGAFGEADFFFVDDFEDGFGFFGGFGGGFCGGVGVGGFVDGAFDADDGFEDVGFF